jgi:hypothetical protein
MTKVRGAGAGLTVRGLLGSLAVVAASVANADPQVAIDSRQVEIYTIYSIMMSNPPMGRENQVYAILTLTRPAIGGTGQPCVVPRPEHSSRWEEVLADYNARVGKPATLVRQLNIAKPYILISQEEAAAFDRAHPGFRPPPKDPLPAAPPLDPKFDGVKTIFALSDVWFSNDGTLALTGLGDSGSAQWKLFEKTADGRWVNVPPARECRMVV